MRMVNPSIMLNFRNCLKASTTYESSEISLLGILIHLLKVLLNQSLFA